jgi:hypothetical protein
MMMVGGVMSGCRGGVDSWKNPTGSTCIGTSSQKADIYAY